MRSSNSQIATFRANRDARARLRRKPSKATPAVLHRRVLPPRNVLVVVLDEQGICWDGTRPINPGPEQEIPEMPLWTYFLPNPLPSNS